jgi:hypothetical protein
LEMEAASSTRMTGRGFGASPCDRRDDVPRWVQILVES